MILNATSSGASSSRSSGPYASAGTLVSENSINALVRLGLLPNYTLHDDATVLDATLWWKDSDGEFDESSTDYGRGSRLALTELAPGNIFHSDEG